MNTLLTTKKFNRIFKNFLDYNILRKDILKYFGKIGVAFWCDSTLLLFKKKNISFNDARKLTVEIFRKKYMIK